MTEKQFYKKQKELIKKIEDGKTLGEKLLAYEEFKKFMGTESQNSHWNPRYNYICVGEKLAELLKEKYLLKKNLTIMNNQ